MWTVAMGNPFQGVDRPTHWNWADDHTSIIHLILIHTTGGAFMQKVDSSPAQVYCYSAVIYMYTYVHMCTLLT